MRKKMYWGIASLILIIGVVGVYFMLQPVSDMEPEMKFIVPSETDLEKARETKQPPPGASLNGHWHDDEWHDEPHEVPVAQNDPPIAQPDTVQPKQPVIDAAGEVIYPHQELLQRHPVAALRAQAKDNGHWSAKYIPPFPPDDAEANDLAHNYYIYNYFASRGDFYNPVSLKAVNAIDKWKRDNGGYGSSTDRKYVGPRHNDLFKLTWTRNDNPNGLDSIAWDSNFTKEDYTNAYNQ